MSKVIMTFRAPDGTPHDIEGDATTLASINDKVTAFERLTAQQSSRSMNEQIERLAVLTLNGDEIRHSLYRALNNVISDARALQKVDTRATSTSDDLALCVLLLKGFRA